MTASIGTGSFVRWNDGEGRVDLIVTKGAVPGVSGEPDASGDGPIARIVVWRDGLSTGEKVALPTGSLRSVPPLGAVVETGITGVIQSQAKHAEYVIDAGLPESSTVTASAANVAYERGVKSWPGKDATTLAAEEWAIGRVMHLFKVAIEGGDTNDADLLHPDHDASEAVAAEPQQPEPEPEPEVPAEETVTVEVEDLEAELAKIDEALKDA